MPQQTSYVYKDNFTFTEVKNLEEQYKFEIFFFSLVACKNIYLQLYNVFFFYIYKCLASDIDSFDNIVYIWWYEPRLLLLQNWFKAIAKHK